MFAAEFGQLNLGQGKVLLCFLLQYGLVLFDVEFFDSQKSHANIRVLSFLISAVSKINANVLFLDGCCCLPKAGKIM